MDFSNVRIHTDRYAAAKAQLINARAFAIGDDLFFNEGRFSPHSSEGLHVLAHELAHVVQTRTAGGDARTMLHALFEDEPLSAGENGDLLAVRIYLILQQWKSDAQEGINDFVFGELAARIDSLESGSWSSFVTALLGNTIWASVAFLPLVMGPAAVPLALATFGLSMAGVLVAAAPTVPSASSTEADLGLIARVMKDYFDPIYDSLHEQVEGIAQAAVRANGAMTGRDALRSFLAANFDPAMIITGNAPNIDGGAVRERTRQVAEALLGQLAYFDNPSGINYVRDENISPLAVAGQSMLNGRIRAELATRMSEILEWQARHPHAGVLVPINMRYRGPSGELNTVERTFVNLYPVMVPENTSREVAIRSYTSQDFAESDLSNEGWYNYTTFHWIPPLGVSTGGSAE